MLSNGNTPVYGISPPTWVAVFAISAGNFVHANVSCTQRTRRNARLEKKCACMPGCVSRPTVAGTLLLHVPGVNELVAGSKRGHVPLVAVSTSKYGWLWTMTWATN